VSQPFRIVFAIYPGMTHLDFTGPHQVLSRTPKSEVIVASRDGGTIEGDGLFFANTQKLSGVDRCDLICVPGGINALKVAQDADFVGGTAERQAGGVSLGVAPTAAGVRRRHR
jgi:putative intracellular protease/amidase